MTTLLQSRLWGLGQKALLLLGLVLCTGFLGFLKDKIDPVQFMLGIKDFQRLASQDPKSAFEQYVRLSAQQDLATQEKVLCPVTDPDEGWSYFFDTSVYSISSICEDTALVMFYSPYCDTALLTVWELKKKSLAVVDAKLFMGDYIRKGGKAPFQPQAYWLSKGQVPVLGLVHSVNATIAGFQKLYGACQSAKELRRWDAKLEGLNDEGLMFLNQATVGLLFEDNFMALDVLFNDPKLAPVVKYLDETVSKLSKGQAKDVLQEATETNAVTASAIANMKPAEWQNMTAVSLVDSDTNSLIFLSPAGNGERFVSLLFSKKGEKIKIRRIDAIDFHNAYRNRNQLP